jgi:glycosyltransferase involved in cell wall biosynthesis
MNETKPLRILHVVGGMNRGGIETWLMHVLRTTDRDQFRMDFVAHTTQRCSYDDELRSLGSGLFACPPPSRMWQYGRGFRKVLAENGPYDVVHSHVHFANGIVLRLARKAGVPVRLAHSHVNSAVEEAQRGLLRQGYIALMRHWVGRHATGGLAASRQAAHDLFGQRWSADQRWRLHLYGLDFAPFHGPVDRAVVRAELKIPEGAFVVGHVGRFAEQKNHSFLLDVAAELSRREPTLHLLLVGEGELRDAVARRADELGLTSRVTFTGSRPDVPRLMRAAMDVFLFPSHYEGLGLVLVEAQAAGLPSVLSDVVPEEADVVPTLIHRVPLTRPASTWADAVLAAKQRHTVPQTEALEAVKRSAFNIVTSCRSLEEVYRASVERALAAGCGARV